MRPFAMGTGSASSSVVHEKRKARAMMREKRSLLFAHDPDKRKVWVRLSLGST